jgi:hypothetical protein
LNNLNLSQSIKDIISFQPIFGDQLVCRDIQGFLKLYNADGFILLHDRDSEDSIFEYGNKIIISRRKGSDISLSYELIEFDRQTSIFKPLVEDVFPLYGYGSKLLFKQYGEAKSGLVQFDLDTQEYEWELDFDFRPFCHVGGIVFGSIGRKRNTVVAVSSIEGLAIWNYDLNDLGLWIDYDGQEKKHQVLRALGVYQSSLYLFLNSGKILVLDIATGEKIAVLKNDKHPKFDTFGDNIELDIKSGKLIQLARQDLIEVDLQTREVSMTQIEDMNTSNVENASRIAYDNTHIYFTDKENGTVSALNRSTHRLDWTHKLSGKGLSESIQPRYGRILKKKGNRLYVLDNRNTLHVFSKQD